MNAKIIPTIAGALILCTALFAQPSGVSMTGRDGVEQKQQRQGRPHRLTPEEKAGRTADRMKSELAISDRQYKKVYKLFLKDAKIEEEQASSRPPREGGRPQGERPEGGQGRGGFEGGQGGPQGEMGPRGGNPQTDVFSEEYIAKREKKLKRILKQEKYDSWRQRHPVEMPPLPEPVFNQ